MMMGGGERINAYGFVESEKKRQKRLTASAAERILLSVARANKEAQGEER